MPMAENEESALARDSACTAVSVRKENGTKGCGIPFRTTWYGASYLSDRACLFPPAPFMPSFDV